MDYATYKKLKAEQSQVREDPAKELENIDFGEPLMKQLQTAYEKANNGHFSNKTIGGYFVMAAVLSYLAFFYIWVLVLLGIAYVIKPELVRLVTVIPAQFLGYVLTAVVRFGWQILKTLYYFAKNKYFTEDIHHGNA